MTNNNYHIRRTFLRFESVDFHCERLILILIMWMIAWSENWYHNTSWNGTHNHTHIQDCSSQFSERDIYIYILYTQTNETHKLPEEEYKNSNIIIT